MKPIILLLLVSSLSGCDIILDELFDCIDQDEPLFNSDKFPPAILNQVYSHTIEASIKHNPNDSYYDYDINFTGSLPTGLSVYKDRNDRTITIQGTPIQLGDFDFSLHVKVKDPNESTYQATNLYDDGDSLCKNTHRQYYTLSVSIM